MSQSGTSEPLCRRPCRASDTAARGLHLQTELPESLLTTRDVSSWSSLAALDARSGIAHARSRQISRRELRDFLTLHTEPCHQAFLSEDERVDIGFERCGGQRLAYPLVDDN